MNKLLYLSSFKLVRISLAIFLLAAGVLFYLYVRYNQYPVCKDCNLILISVDTLRADHMGVYGYDRNTTPNIDNWAKSATVFSNFYTIFPLTPHSFFTLFTGTDEVLNGPLTGAYPTHIEKYTDKATLTTILKSNNYRTAAFVTNPVVGVVLKFFRRGFDDFRFVNTSGLNNYDPLIYNNTYKDQIKLTNESIQWLDKNHDKKFFLWLHYLDPHAPYLPNDQYLCRIDVNTCANRTYSEMLDAAEDPKYCILKLSENDKQHEINLYDAELLSTDHQIGRVLEAIKKLNITKKTVVILLADHGEGFDHDMYHHVNSLYNSVLKIPLIIYIPNAKKKNSDMLVDNTNITPTLLNLLSIKFDDKTFSGKSFIDTFNKLTYKTPNNLIYFRIPTDRANRIGVTDGNYKYMLSDDNYCTVKNKYNEELYDLKKDPEELDNLAEKDRILAEKYQKYLSDKFRKPVSPLPDSQIRNGTMEEFKSLGY